jgi:hypothetical protein
LRSWLPHFLKTRLASADFIRLNFDNGCCKPIFEDFLRKLKNRSGSISVQIISKERGKYKVVKTLGSSSYEH